MARPDTLHAMKLSIDYGKRFKVSTPAIGWIRTDLQAIAPRANRSMFAYIPSGTPSAGRFVAWCLSDAEGHSMVRVNYHPRLDEAEQSVQERWSTCWHANTGRCALHNKDRMEGARLPAIPEDPGRQSPTTPTVLYSDGTQPADTRRRSCPGDQGTDRRRALILPANGVSRCRRRRRISAPAAVFTPRASGGLRPLTGVPKIAASPVSPLLWASP